MSDKEVADAIEELYSRDTLYQVRREGNTLFILAIDEGPEVKVTVE